MFSNIQYVKRPAYEVYEVRPPRTEIESAPHYVSRLGSQAKVVLFVERWTICSLNRVYPSGVYRRVGGADATPGSVCRSSNHLLIERV